MEGTPWMFLRSLLQAMTATWCFASGAMDLKEALTPSSNALRVKF